MDQTKNDVYISELCLDSDSHIIAKMSDGRWVDVGYMPTHSITLHFAEEEQK